MFSKVFFSRLVRSGNGLEKSYSFVYKPLSHSHTITPFDAPGNKPFENTVGKGEIARNEQFLLFPQCFLPVWITFFHFCQILKLSSANSFSLEESKICRLVMGSSTVIYLIRHASIQILNNLKTSQLFSGHLSVITLDYLPFPL